MILSIFLKICFFAVFFLDSRINKTVDCIKKERYVKSIVICSYNKTFLTNEFSKNFNAYESRMFESILNDYLANGWYDPKSRSEIYYIDTQKSKQIKYISFVGAGKKIEIIFKDFEKSIIVEDAPSLVKVELDPSSIFDSSKLPRLLIKNIQSFIKKLPKSNQKYKKYRKLIVYYCSSDFNIRGIIYLNNKNKKEYFLLFNNMIVNRKGYSVKRKMFSRYFGLNCKYVLTSKFGYRCHPIWKTPRFHSGIDLKVSSGTPVYSVYSGKIIFRGWMNGYGNCVKIAHGKRVISLYAHLSKFVKNVKVGSFVDRGTLIAFSGSTGYSTAPHLHLEFRVNNRPVDPFRFKFYYHVKISDELFKDFKLFLYEIDFA